jgi:hypothetical protein
VNASSREHHRNHATITCAECKCSSGLNWHGWRAIRTDDVELGEPPALAFYCPVCALREFGPLRKQTPPGDRLPGIDGIGW